MNAMLSFSVMGRSTLQGLPAATTPAGISFVTTLPAPMVVPSPMVTPGRIVTSPPSQTLSSSVMGFVYSRQLLSSYGRTGWMAVYMPQFGPMKQCVPMVIFAQSIR